MFSYLSIYIYIYTYAIYIYIYIEKERESGRVLVCSSAHLLTSFEPKKRYYFLLKRTVSRILVQVKGANRQISKAKSGQHFPESLYY